MSVTNNNFIIINNNQRFSAESCSFCTVIDIMFFNYDSNNAFLYFFDSTFLKWNLNYDKTSPY